MNNEQKTWSWINFMLGIIFGFSSFIIINQIIDIPTNSIIEELREAHKNNKLLELKLNLYEQKYNTLLNSYNNKCGKSYINDN